MSRNTIKTQPASPPADMDQKVLTYLRHLVTILADNFRTLANADATGWRPINVPATGNRDLDADTATLDETRKCLARLIQDFKDAGVLSK